MSIKRKIALLTTLWLVGILLAVNLTIFFAFMRVTTDNERDLLVNRANTLLEKTKLNDLMHGRSTDLLQSYLPDNGMIRVLDTAGHPLQTLESSSENLQIDPVSVTSEETQVYKNGLQQTLIARVPIKSGNIVIGTIEIFERLDALQENIYTLISIMSICSIGAIGMSLIGGIYLSKWILRPISNVVRIMEDIEQSLAFRTIPLDDGHKDELHAMASTFNRMMGRLQENFVRQEQFISDASHELKTPLTAIEGYANMLRRWGFRDEEKGLEAVQSIYSEAVRMKNITENLLQLAYTENERELKKEPIELVSFCEDAVQLPAKLYNREIHLHSSAKELFLLANAFKINQLLLILMDNALKYSNNSVELILDEKKMSSRRGIEIRVKDRGIGIPKSELPRVFERFYRVDPSRHRETGGTGLGLAIAKNIVRLHEGTIEIESEEHLGTEVIVFIPQVNVFSS